MLNLREILDIKTWMKNSEYILLKMGGWLFKSPFYNKILNNYYIFEIYHTKQKTKASQTVICAKFSSMNVYVYTHV